MNDSEKEQDAEQLPQRRKDDHVRLDSWKAIANYLNRSVRTARRWEAHEELPVRRHKHSKGASVYAYQVELDAWQAQRRNQESISAGDDEIRLPQPEPARSWKLAAGVAAAAFAVGIAADRVWQSQVSGNALVPGDVADVSESSSIWAQSIARTVMAPVFELWADGKVEESVAASEDVRGRIAHLPQDVREHVTALRALHSISLGRAGEAMVIADAIMDPAQRAQVRALIFLASGEKQNMQDELARVDKRPGSAGALLLAMSGQAAEAMAVSSLHGLDESTSTRARVVEGLAKIQAGEIVEARNKLSVSSLVLEPGDRAYFFVALDALAGTYKAQGDIGQAIEVLEETMSRRLDAAVHGDGIFWLMCQRNLAQLYAANDRPDDAAAINSEIRRMMVAADESFPLARASLET
jgi:hypothetical protein